METRILSVYEVADVSKGYKQEFVVGISKYKFLLYLKFKKYKKDRLTDVLKEVENSLGLMVIKFLDTKAESLEGVVKTKGKKIRYEVAITKKENVFNQTLI